MLSSRRHSDIYPVGGHQIVATRRPSYPGYTRHGSFDSIDSLDYDLGGRSYARSIGGTYYNPPNTPTLPFYWNGARWTRLSSNTSLISPYVGRNKIIQFYTWNVDFQAPHAEERLFAALNHLRSHISTGAPTVINLQEVSDIALSALLNHPWVRQNFQLTDVEPIGTYFTVTLVSLTLRIEQVFRAPFYSSRMNRDVLIVDIDVRTVAQTRGGVLRIANTHLESTAEGVAERPKQMAVIANYLKQPGVVAGVVGGDMNAMLSVEKSLHMSTAIRLRDAFALNGSALGAFKGRGRYGDTQGHTFGYQSGRYAVSNPTRRDKILYWGDVGFTHSNGKAVRRVGVGLQYWLDNGAYSSNLRWVSDHFGLCANLVIGGGRR